MPYFLLSLAACFWGGNYVVGHLLVAHADPIVLSAARWIFTALCIIACTLFSPGKSAVAIDEKII